MSKIAPGGYGMGDRIRVTYEGVVSNLTLDGVEVDKGRFFLYEDSKLRSIEKVSTPFLPTEPGSAVRTVGVRDWPSYWLLHHDGLWHGFANRNGISAVNLLRAFPSIDILFDAGAPL